MTPVSLAERLAELKSDAASEVEPHAKAIRAALREIDTNLQAIRDKGVSVEIAWPYGRGESAKAASARLSMSLEVRL